MTNTRWLLITLTSLSLVACAAPTAPPSTTVSFPTARPLATPSPTTPPTPSPTPFVGGRHIAFTSNRGAHFQVYLIDLEESSETPISETGGDSELPVWSPQGDALAYSGHVADQHGFYQQQVLLFDMRTQATAQLTSGSANTAPSWSPSGKAIAFLSDLKGSWGLYTMARDGSQASFLVGDLGYIDAPQWSTTTGEIIVPSMPTIVSDFDLLLATAGKVGALNLTDNDFTDADPSWSPDGRTVAFESDRNGKFQLFTMLPDGSSISQITTGLDSATLPRWSPDGSQIAFQGWSEGNLDIYLINADGTGLSRLTDDPAPDVSPVWSPDGHQIVFVTLRDDPNWTQCSDTRACNSELYLIEASDGHLTRLTDNSYPDVAPAWQPSP